MSIMTRTTNNFTFRNYHNDSSYLWFVAAQRLQWGQAKAIGSVRTKEFAITFSSECNIAMALPWKDDGLAYQINIQNVELSSFKYYYYTASAEVEICYIAFGV